MLEFSYYYGIDISKDVLDLMDQNDLHFQVENNLKGFKQIMKPLGKDACVVMEASVSASPILGQSKVEKTLTFDYEKISIY